MTRAELHTAFGPALSEDACSWTRLKEVFSAASELVDHLVALSKSLGPRINVVFTDSSGCACRTVTDSTEAANPVHTIVIPAGLIARLLVVSLGLEAYKHGENTGIVDGIYYDDFPPDIRDDKARLPPPPGMEAAFSAYLEPAQFWPLIEKSLTQFGWRSLEQPGAANLLSPLAFIMLHEFGHILLRHESFLQTTEEIRAEVLGLSGEIRANFQRCVEIHADLFAIDYQVRRAVGTAKEADHFVEYAAELLRRITYGYVVALLFIPSSHRGLRSFDDPAVRAYSHPAIRERLVNRLLFETLREILDHDDAEALNSTIARATLSIVYSLNRWYLHELFAARNEASITEFAIPFPYNFLPVAFSRTCEEAWRQLDEYESFIGTYILWQRI